MELKQMVRGILPDDMIIWIKAGLDFKNQKKMLKKKMGIKPYQAGKYPMGINLIGDVKAETGLGQSMRILAEILEKSDVPFVIRQIDSPGGLSLSDDRLTNRISDRSEYAINLIHINPSIWAENYIRFPAEILDYRYNIAYWLWELEEFPEKWVPCIETVDEIWTPSEFISQSIRKKTARKVETVPYWIRLDEEDNYGREHFGLPQDKFLFLMMYDFKSVSERKNPRAAIEAYTKAFGKEETGTGLIIKINHLSKIKELESLKNRLDGYQNIYYIIDNLSRKEVESLIKVSDVLISLHRSEGFGLPIAEAMYLGTPVVATAWSANTEFMDENSSCLVDYSLVEIKKNTGPYQKGNRWAEPDIEQASNYLRKLYLEKEYFNRLKRKGKVHIEKTLDGKRAVRIITKKCNGDWSV